MFADRLTTSLSLTIGSATYALIAGQIERFELDLQPWGFVAEVTFHISSEQEEDPLFEAFHGSDPIALRFAFERETDGEDVPPVGLSTGGYAISRSVLEVVGERLKGQPVIGRRYQVRVVDALQAFWTQHRPIELYAAAAMQDLLDASKPAGVELTYDWTALTAKLDVLAVALDGEAEPSFYDFVLWWIDRNQGVFEFNPATGSYRIAGKKLSGRTAVTLDAEDVALLRMLFPEPPRFGGRVLNPVADAPTTKELQNPLAVSGVRRDVLARTPIAAEADRRAQLESLRFRARPAGVELTYKRCPAQVPAPGGLLAFEDGFSARTYAAGESYRVTRVRAAGLHRPGVTVEPEDASAVYDMELTVELEEQHSAVAWLPRFRDPRRTLRVEGKIVSSGAAGQRSWAAIENENNSLWMYKVFIPVFNKQIPAPFTPNFASGHFFFPAYKDQRVLVDIDFDRAAVTGFLDWADEGRLPSDTQGNQIVLGFESGNGTVVRHSYQDASPVLSIERKTSSETSTVVMGDGVLRIALMESKSIPTTIPLYDVSPQVDAAKDAVVGEVDSSVTEVTAQLETAVGQISSAIEDTGAAVEAEIDSAEKALSGKLDDVETQLQGMFSDATAAVASVSMGVTRGKARLSSAVQSVDQVRAPLTALQARWQLFRTRAGTRVAELKQEIAQVDQVIAAPLDALSVRAAAVREKVKNRLSSLRSSIDALGPHASGGPFHELLALRQEVQGFDADLQQLPTRIEAALDTFGQSIVNDWGRVDGQLGTLANACTGSFERGAQSLSSRSAALRAKLDAKLGATPSAALAARGTAARARLTALEQAARAGLDTARTQARDGLSVLQGRAQAARDQVRSAGTGAASSAQQAASALSDGTAAVSAALTDAQDALTSAAASATSSLQSSVQALQDAVMPPLDATPAAIETAKRSLAQAVVAARDALLEPLAAIDRLLSSLDSAVQGPLSAALAAIDTAENTALSTVSSVSATLDSVMATAQSTLNGFVSTFQSLVDGAGTALDAVRSLVDGARAQIMPPIEALESLVDQLQSTFQTGVNLLTAFVDSASATLDAIPAASLPQAMVQPAITAISTALDAVLPLIQTAAQTAGDTLSNLGTSLVGQVQTAENTALSAVSTFVTTITQQVDAVLPPVQEQLAAVQTQIDNAIEQVMTQIDTATTAAVTTIQTTFDAASAQAQSIATAASEQLDSADTQLAQTVSDIRAQIASKRAALTAQAQTLLDSASRAVESAATRLDETGATIEAAIARARTSLQAQVTAARTSQQARLQDLRTRAQQLPTSLDQQLAPLRTRNQQLAAQLTASLPKPSDFDAAVSAITSPALAQYASLEQEIDGFR